LVLIPARAGSFLLCAEGFIHKVLASFHSIRPGPASSQLRHVLPKGAAGCDFDSLGFAFSVLLPKRAAGYRRRSRFSFLPQPSCLASGSISVAARCRSSLGFFRGAPPIRVSALPEGAPSVSFPQQPPPSDQFRCLAGCARVLAPPPWSRSRCLPQAPPLSISWFVSRRTRARPRHRSVFLAFPGARRLVPGSSIPGTGSPRRRPVESSLDFPPSGFPSAESAHGFCCVSSPAQHSSEAPPCRSACVQE
jgi:hypothetical protein